MNYGYLETLPLTSPTAGLGLRAVVRRPICSRFSACDLLAERILVGQCFALFHLGEIRADPNY